jgi:hypothetical protein
MGDKKHCYFYVESTTSAVILRKLTNAIERRKSLNEKLEKEEKQNEANKANVPNFKVEFKLENKPVDEPKLLENKPVEEPKLLENKPVE